LSADRDEPLIVNQPEDHLDAQYVASSIVSQLEAAKERRQVVIATHSANLAVLGDAEVVIPMFAAGGRGAPEEPRAVDRPDTRERVCQLLEGGREAYRRHGERYGSTCVRLSGEGLASRWSPLKATLSGDGLVPVLPPAALKLSWVAGSGERPPRQRLGPSSEWGDVSAAGSPYRGSHGSNDPP
jgi:hypothetical protein